MHEYTPAADQVVRTLADLTRRRLAEPRSLGRIPSATELQQSLGSTITPDGVGAHHATELWSEVIAPACLSPDHPRFFAFMPNCPTIYSAAFDGLVGASSIYAGAWLEGAGAIHAENQVLRWIADLAGFPASAGGTFVSGGTTGNLSALVAARHSARSADERRSTAGAAVCISESTHSSIRYLLESVMGVDVITVPPDDRGRLTGKQLGSYTQSIGPDKRAEIFAVVATAGSTNAGTVDDLEGVADVAEEFGWWLHVDGAYGGAGLLAPELEDLYRGIERADSFIVDPHKWLFGPYDSCALVYRDRELAQAAHAQNAAYLDPLADASEVNPSDLGTHLTRRARGLPLWFSLAAHGTNAYRAAIEQTLLVARAGADLIRADEHLKLLVEPDLSVLLFERTGWDSSDYSAWSSQLLRDQVAFVTPTQHKGEPCIRLAILNPTTTVDDLLAIFESMH
ncbi:pyridoxal phosphate-dependent decarboxylase family protein [Streptomyces antimycoticus]|uniref:pyridoxal phosphate-dependent decarboxylase family protein n=1 Tax=Streptomyces antimycoticus TaxID=68175 RepID=UPI000A3A7A0A|nr:aminotransferase class V-fold PLP-dependent enzyme [Streptomyces antimycoticus]